MQTTNNLASEVIRMQTTLCDKVRSALWDYLNTLKNTSVQRWGYVTQNKQQNSKVFHWIIKLIFTSIPGGLHYAHYESRTWPEFTIQMKPQVKRSNSLHQWCTTGYVFHLCLSAAVHRQSISMTVSHFVNLDECLYSHGDGIFPRCVISSSENDFFKTVVLHTRFLIACNDSLQHLKTHTNIFTVTWDSLFILSLCRSRREDRNVSRVLSPEHISVCKIKHTDVSRAAGVLSRLRHKSSPFLKWLRVVCCALRGTQLIYTGWESFAPVISRESWL